MKRLLQRNQTLLLRAGVVSSLSFFGTQFTSHCESEKYPKGFLNDASTNELKDRLKKKLQPIRQAKHSSPSVKLGQYDKTCIGLSFVIASHDQVLPSLSVLAKGLKHEHADIQIEGSADGAQLSLVFEDGSGSVLVSTEHDGSTELILFKERGEFSDVELNSFVKGYERGGFSIPGVKVNRSTASTRVAGSADKHGGEQGDVLEKLESLGAIVYKHEETSAESGLDWSCLAGYEKVQEEVEDTVLLGLKHPEEYDNVTRKTRERFESNRPRAILFEGPPGTGKTTTARIVANLASVPMIYIPIESVMSKWFGESESKLSEILKLCDTLGTSIVFLDEIDSLATSRDSGGNMHEATRRLLSVLLRTLEGFQERSNSILIAATNRKQDLDAALVSRFDTTVPFPLPSKVARKEIFQRYAKQLSDKELDKLASMAEGFSGRDIKDVCKHAERRWVSIQLRSAKSSLDIDAPHLQYYEEALALRQQQLRM